MPVHSRYDASKAGDVLQNAHPNVYSYPWIPIQQAVRANPLPASSAGSTGPTGAGASKTNYGTRVQRIQPNEKQGFFEPRGFSMGAASPARSGCGCGCSGNEATKPGHNK